MGKQLEIERKFLLKSIPDFGEEKVDTLLIHQIYVKKNGVVTRYRRSRSLVSDEVTFVQCNKKRLSAGVFEEIEKPIIESEFLSLCKKKHSFIIKTRFVYKKNGLKWEIDKYDGICLITLEVELKSINQKIKIPKIISDKIIVEVTGQKEFSNQSLSFKSYE